MSVSFLIVKKIIINVNLIVWITLLQAYNIDILNNINSAKLLHFFHILVKINALSLINSK